MIGDSSTSSTIRAKASGITHAQLVEYYEIRYRNKMIMNSEFEKPSDLKDAKRYLEKAIYFRGKEIIRKHC